MQFDEFKKRVFLLCHLPKMPCKSHKATAWDFQFAQPVFKSCLIERMIRDMMQLCQPPPSFQTLGRPPGQLDRRMSATARCTSLHMCSVCIMGSVCIMCIGDLGNMPLTPTPLPVTTSL